MPAHDYFCDSCLASEEVVLSIQLETPQTWPCKGCGRQMRLLVSAPAHIWTENQLEFQEARWTLKQFDKAHDQFINPKNFKRNTISRPLRDRAKPLHRRGT